MRSKTKAWMVGMMMIAEGASASAADVDAASQRLFASTKWGGVYMCLAADRHMHPDNAKTDETAMQSLERAFAIPKAHGPAFRKLADEKVAALAVEGKLEQYRERECPKAEVHYITTGKGQ